MPQRRHVARAALTAAAATALLGLAAAPAWATGNSHNPKGDNGTVKIDGVEFTDKVDNEPHVTCEFELEFFNFDQDQKANITLWAQAPSATPKDKVVWSKSNVLLSTDPASGAENDHDEVVKLSSKDLDLSGLTLKEKGYHIKLDVDLTDGKSSDAKHKVFWLTPCMETSSPSPSPTPTPSDSESPETPTSPTSPGSSVGGGAGGGSGTEGGLPLTGVAATSISLTGLALIGGGVLLMALRRRRDKITFTS
ncbi:LPXTG cell wall anchor domain-containing protein [Micromonospora chersina]|uniref:LPXTG cell wall anchor domain-containing protein n=1 Tax=Micromonospora chersina TaxID=47854 RepID=UPI0033BD7173